MDNDIPKNNKVNPDGTLPMSTEPQSLRNPIQQSAPAPTPNTRYPLPPQQASQEPEKIKDRELAVDVIRGKVEQAYKNEPSFAAEVKEIEDLTPKQHLSPHQHFLEKLLNSGKSLEGMQADWHTYYASLSNEQKHEVWREFYANQPEAEHYANLSTSSTPEAHLGKMTRPKTKSKLSGKTEQSLANLKASVAKRLPTEAIKYRPPKHIQSILFGLMAGGIAILIMLFSFFNQQIIAPFIQPSRISTNTPLISSAAVGPNPEVIIPKINVEIPVVYDVNTIDEDSILAGLENGAVHYADTALPGQNGNLVIVGHSSNNIFNKGKYKFAFVLLNRLEIGDSFYLQKDSQRYTYEVYKRTIVEPNDVSVLGMQDLPATASLITCDPPGTSSKRLVVVGKQISPDPAGNSSQTAPANLASQSKTVPGNAPSLWHRLWTLLSR